MRKNAVIQRDEEKNSFYTQCFGKTKYTKKEAITAAKASVKRGKTDKIAYYPCSYCNGWHLTHTI